ncbi:hypothetical protein ACSYAD_31630 [Acaryochloris marina NIES-2412]|uniref:hypothetical protein n=1 Tax=Acaryochloris marina TaxID=155978 RepID=UPI004057FBA4
MVYIPSLTQTQLRILRIVKKYPDKAVRLSYEIPVICYGDEPIGYPAFLQKLIDLGLVEVCSKRVRYDSSRYQRDSWNKYSEDLEMPSIRAWELWRDKYIARQEGSKHILMPGEEFEHFSGVWIQEIGLRAIQPSEDSILQ